MGGNDVAGRGHDEGEGVLGGCGGVGVWGVHDDDALAGGLVNVHIVGSHSGPANHLQPLPGLKHGCGDLGAGADDQGVIVDDGFDQFGFGQAGADVNRDIIGFGEHGYAVVAKLVGDQNVEHGWYS